MNLEIEFLAWRGDPSDVFVEDGNDVMAYNSFLIGKLLIVIGRESFVSFGKENYLFLIKTDSQFL